MELLNSIISAKSPIFPFTALKENTPSRFFIPNSKNFPLQRPFSLYFPLSYHSRFRISAHFGRPTSRQNYLRKKLTEQQQKVSHSSDLQNPNLKFLDTEASESNFDGYIERSSNFDTGSGVDEDVSESTGIRESDLGSKSKLLGESALWNKLENWVEQYKKDIEFWGMGAGPIFTVFQDSKGKVERVIVNEDEILRRKGVGPVVCDEGDVEQLTEVNSRISYAKTLARDMENGKNVLPGNSSVAKFVYSYGKSDVMNFIQEVTLKPGLFSKLSKFGVMLVCGFFVISAIKLIFTVGNDRQEYTKLEKEMIRRKIKARMDKEKSLEGSVEVIQDSEELRNVSVERPQLDKQELIKNIMNEKGSNNTMGLPECPGSLDTLSVDFDHRIQEIRTMARHVRDLEKRGPLMESDDGEEDQTISILDESSQIGSPDGYPEQTENPVETRKSISSCHDSGDDCGFLIDLDSSENDRTQAGKITDAGVLVDANSCTEDMGKEKLALQSLDTIKISEKSNASNDDFLKPGDPLLARRFRVIQSVKEARDYLAKKHDKIETNDECKERTSEQVDENLTKSTEKKLALGTGRRLDSTDKALDNSTSTKTPNSILMFENSTSKIRGYLQSNGSNPTTVQKRGDENLDLGASRESGTEPSFTGLPKVTETEIEMNLEHSDLGKSLPCEIDIEASDSNSSSSISFGDSSLEEKQSIPAEENVDDFKGKKGGFEFQAAGTSSGQKSSKRNLALSVNKENWMEKNFHEFEPIVEKIGVGFRDNYMVAKEKATQDMDSKMEMMQLISDEDGSELEWMKDERLREIVFKVRDNELAGRDPFFSVDDADKLAFFSGLEKKVEQENSKLVSLHKWVHSNIENLDYGADGISLYDPPEKIIPRWKGLPVENIPEFIKNSTAQPKESASKDIQNSSQRRHNGTESLQQSNVSVLHVKNTQPKNKSPRAPRTLIEGSDGSIRSGKKSGKEFWHHTKRWSQGFLDSYNAETDPEIKAVMKDMGKDLDRWITEKEIKEAADLMDKLPERGQKIIKEKLDKVKREMELFGPHAVVSKYREYADEKEEDYLWWLDLPYILCIELYTTQDGEQKAGFYSLEMAADLELEPKQYHVIAFEDASDCKNLCYIIQAHMEMLGNGNAFVVARPPKDAFRDAKDSGFGVTVIKRGELQLNVDHTLEEVEELITEIGSKIYQDKIMREHSLDMNAVMKGVFGIKKPIKRKRRKLKNTCKLPSNTKLRRQPHLSNAHSTANFHNRAEDIVA